MVQGRCERGASGFAELMFGDDAVHESLLVGGRNGSSTVPSGAVHHPPDIRRAKFLSRELHQRTTVASNDPLEAFLHPAIIVRVLYGGLLEHDSWRPASVPPPRIRGANA